MPTQSAIKFTLEVRDSYKEDGPRTNRQVVVISDSYENAKNAYYQYGGKWEVAVEHIINVESASLDDLKMVPQDTWIVDPAIVDVIFYEKMEPIPANANPFHHDAWSMGTDLVRGIIIMHDGFDSKEQPRPLSSMYIVETRTGRQNRIHLNNGKRYPTSIEAIPIDRSNPDYLQWGINAGLAGWDLDRAKSEFTNLFALEDRDVNILNKYLSGWSLGNGEYCEYVQRTTVEGQPA